MRALMRRVSHWFTGLRFRLLLLVLVACAPLVGLTLHTASEERRREEATWSRRPQRMLQLASREEDQLIGQTRQLLLAVSESAAAQAGQWQACYSLLTELGSNHPAYANLGVVRTNGEVVVAVPGPVEPGNQSGRRFFRQALETGAFAIGEYGAGTTNAKATVTFGCPVIDTAGRVQGVVFAALDLSWFGRWVAEAAPQLPKTATVTELDHQGAVLTRYALPEDGASSPVLSGAALTAILSKPRGVIEALDARGIPMRCAFASRESRLLSSEVTLVLAISRSVLFATANRMLWRNLAWLGMAAALALTLGWIGSNVLVLRPVKALVISTGRLAAGDLTVRTGLPHGKDEIGQLTRAFDQMAAALEERERQRQEAEETLATRDHMIRELPVLPAAVYVCNPEGEIELYNRAAAELWGYEPPNGYANRRFCGSHLLRRLDGTFLPHAESPMAEVLRTGTPRQNQELIIERPNQSRVTVLANVVPLRDPEGELMGAVGCLQDISDRKAAEERMQEYNEKLQWLSRRLVESQENERRHIARELHDEVGQSVTVAEMNLQALLRSPRAQSLTVRVVETLRAVERVREQVHDLSLNLRPAMLDDLGLEPALRWYVNRQTAPAGLKVEIQIGSLAGRLDPVIETACFRVAQEALTNVVRHAHAKGVVVDLRQQEGYLHLRVRDDGVGFHVAARREQAAHGASLGLLSMEERTVLAEGGFECISSPGEGTEVHAWFPLRWRSEES
jgi:PAS domain S-box-containing protein